MYQNILFKNVCACYPQNTLASQMFQNFLFQLFSFQMTPLSCLESVFCWRYDVTNLPQFSRNYPKNALFQWLPNLRSGQLIFTLTFFSVWHLDKHLRWANEPSLALLRTIKMKFIRWTMTKLLEQKKYIPNLSFFYIKILTKKYPPCLQ